MKIKTLYIYILFIFSVVTYSFWGEFLSRFNIHIFHPCNSIFIFLLTLYIVYIKVDCKNLVRSLFEIENIIILLLISTFVNCIKELFFDGTLFYLTQIVTILFLFIVYYVIKLKRKL